MFSRSRLFLRLKDASDQFTAAAGLPPDMNFLETGGGQPERSCDLRHRESFSSFTSRAFHPGEFTPKCAVANSFEI